MVKKILEGYRLIQEELEVRKLINIDFIKIWLYIKLFTKFRSNFILNDFNKINIIN
tara:strand:+ start:169 stop:336 length:168 start_codon:yes stop_codon:yes gene_type:complete